MQAFVGLMEWWLNAQLTALESDRFNQFTLKPCLANWNGQSSSCFNLSSFLSAWKEVGLFVFILKAKCHFIWHGYYISRTTWLGNWCFIQHTVSWRSSVYIMHRDIFPTHWQHVSPPYNIRFLYNTAIGMLAMLFYIICGPLILAHWSAFSIIIILFTQGLALRIISPTTCLITCN